MIPQGAGLLCFHSSLEHNPSVYHSPVIIHYNYKSIMEGSHLIDETDENPFSLQNQEDILEMNLCFASSKQGCNGEGSSRSDAEQSGKTEYTALVPSKEHKSSVKIRNYGRFRKRDLGEIQTRLMVLEEQRSAMKVLLEGVNERKRLIDEVYQQFQQIDTSLLSASVTAYSPKERERGRITIGLSEILGQTSNPLILRKEQRAATVKCCRNL